jgi:hypothetical protein
VFQTGEQPTADLALDVVLDRLSARQLMDAVLVMGSAPAGAEAGNLGPASDYDLFVVLKELPTPLRLVLTRVDHRLTEVYFASVSTLEQLAAGAPLPPAAEEMRGAVLKWIQNSRDVGSNGGWSSPTTCEFPHEFL